jgi:hypothetical protein
LQGGHHVRRWNVGHTAAGVCKNCAAGKSSGGGTNKNEAACVDCLAGKWAIEGQATACADCDAGKSVAAGSGTLATKGSCANYAAGKWAAAGAACVDCLAGKWAIAGQATACADCDAGKSVAADSGTLLRPKGSCANCDAGKFAAVGDPLGCQNCALGFWNDKGNVASCAKPTKCPVGTGQLSTYVGAAKLVDDGCTDCVAGTYNDDATAKVCKPSECAGAAAGQYDGLDLPALTPKHCAVKVGGTNTNCAAATTSALCATASTAGAVTGAANACEFIPGARTATQDCRTCPAGQFGGAGATRATCTQCVAGKYQNERGQKACKDMTCCLGTFSDETGQTSTKGSCKKCAAGKFGNEGGKATACKNCAAGEFTKEAGRNLCRDVLPSGREDRDVSGRGGRGRQGRDRRGPCRC